MFSETFLAEWQPRILSVLRIMVGLLFLQHGLVKLFGFPVAGPASLPPLLMAAASIELVGGVLLVVGLFTRIAAFIMSGEMAFAYFISHAPRGFYPYAGSVAPANGGEAAVLYCFVFLYLAVAGAGPWSVDATRARA